MADRTVVGKTYPPFTVRVEHGKIREYAEAIRDDNPLYRDEAAARRSPFGGIIAPPTFARRDPEVRRGIRAGAGPARWLL